MSSASASAASSSLTASSSSEDPPSPSASQSGQPESENIISVALASRFAKNQNKKTSWVWTYLAATLGDPLCDICESVVRYGKSKSTSALTSHVQARHREIFDENLQVEAERKRKTAGSLEAFVVYGGNFMKEYIQWIVETYQPISTCDNIYFRRMCESLSPGKTQMLTSQTVLRELLKIKNQLSESMKEYLVG